MILFFFSDLITINLSTSSFRKVGHKLLVNNRAFFVKIRNLREEKVLKYRFVKDLRAIVCKCPGLPIWLKF